MNVVRIIHEPDVPRHQTVRSVVKATQLLLCIADAASLTAVQAAEAVGIPMGTAYHLLNTLLAEGMLSRDQARRYSLGPKVAALSLAYARRGPSEQVLLQVRDLAEATGETAYFSAWHDGQVAAIAAIEGTSIVRVGRIHTELRGHEHARASGKILLAHLDPTDLDAYIATHQLEARTPSTIVEIEDLRRQLDIARERGYAIDEAEFTAGVGCVAAPIWEGRLCVASIAVSAPLERFHRNHASLVEAVVASAQTGSHA